MKPNHARIVTISAVLVLPLQANPVRPGDVVTSDVVRVCVNPQPITTVNATVGVEIDDAISSDERAHDTTLDEIIDEARGHNGIVDRGDFETYVWESGVGYVKEG
jgi:hypothetical protein